MGHDVKPKAYLFDPSKFAKLVIYDASLFHVYFSFLSHKLVVLKLLETQCSFLAETDLTRNKYRSSFYARRIEEAKREFISSIWPKSVETAKKLFWDVHNFDCVQLLSQGRLSC